jgi:hypothetical protein
MSDERDNESPVEKFERLSWFYADMEDAKDLTCEGEMQLKEALKWALEILRPIVDPR